MVNPFEGIPWEKKNTRDKFGKCTLCGGKGTFILSVDKPKYRRYLTCDKCSSRIVLPSLKFGPLVRSGTCRKHDVPLVVTSTGMKLCPKYRACKFVKCYLKTRHKRFPYHK